MKALALLLALVTWNVPRETVAQVPTFPNAEGHGAEALASCRQNGVAPDVRLITSLASSGSGTYREAFEAATQTNRLLIAVPDTFGVISNTEIIANNNRHCFLFAGFLGPGPTVFTGSRHRIRSGNTNLVWVGATAEDGGIWLLNNGSSNILVSNWTCRWYGAASGGNQCMSWSTSDGPIEKTSFLSFMQAESYEGHPVGFFFQSSDRYNPDHEKVTVARGWFHSISHRQPLCSGVYRIEVINIYISNNNQGAIHCDRETILDVLGVRLWRHGNWSSLDANSEVAPSGRNNAVAYGVSADPDCPTCDTIQIHTTCIIGPFDSGRTPQQDCERQDSLYWVVADSTRVVGGYASSWTPANSLLPLTMRSATRNAIASPYPTTYEPMWQVEDSVLKYAGDRWRRTCGYGAQFADRWIEETDSIYDRYRQERTDSAGSSGPQAAGSRSAIARPKTRNKCSYGANMVPDQFEVDICGTPECLQADSLYNGYYPIEHALYGTDPGVAFDAHPPFLGHGGFLAEQPATMPPPTYGSPINKRIYLASFRDSVVISPTLDTTFTCVKCLPFPDSMLWVSGNQNYTPVRLGAVEHLLVSLDSIDQTIRGYLQLDSIQADSVCTANGLTGCPGVLMQQGTGR